MLIIDSFVPNFSRFEFGIEGILRMVVLSFYCTERFSFQMWGRWNSQT